MAVVKDLSGQRFGRLVALRCVGRTNNGNATWLCKCDCGNEAIIASYALKTGRTRSCGCYKQEMLGKASITHGDSGVNKTRLYGIWAGIKTRCYNEHQAESYKKYGKRGISMCDEWRNSYASFRDWAFSNGYRDDLTIDRIDNNGPYEPSNCRWASVKEQNNNRRSNHYLTFNGKTQSIAQWTEEAGFGRSVIEHRLSRGWSVEAALQTPMKALVNGHYVYTNTGIRSE